MDVMQATLNGITIAAIFNGAMSRFVYKNALRNIFHSWAKVDFENKCLWIISSTNKAYYKTVSWL